MIENIANLRSTVNNRTPQSFLQKRQQKKQIFNSVSNVRSPVNQQMVAFSPPAVGPSPPYIQEIDGEDDSNNQNNERLAIAHQPPR